MDGVPHYVFLDEVRHKLYLAVEDKPALMEEIEVGQSVYIEGEITKTIGSWLNRGSIIENVTYVLDKKAPVNKDDKLIGGSHD